MNQSNFSLADVFSVLAAMTFGFVCFLSNNFLSLGDIMSSAIIASIIAFVLGGLALGAKLLKRARKNFRTSLFFELFFLLCFSAVAFILVLPFSHFFHVYDKKEEIQEKLLNNFTVSDNIYTKYEDYANNRIELYEGFLNGVGLAELVNQDEFIKYDFEPGVDINTQVENKMFTLKAKLYPPNYMELKNNFISWLSESKGKIEIWSPIAIINVLNTVKNEINSKNDQLQELSKFRAKGELCNDFSFPIFLDDVSKTFSTLGSSTPLSILFAVVLYILILFSYFITSRPIGPLSVNFFSGLWKLFFQSKQSDNYTL
jgi:hypothetical protein